MKNREKNKIINIQAPEIDNSEVNFTREERRILAQLRTGKSPFLLDYLNKVDPITYPSNKCTLCTGHIHDVFHLFNCPEVDSDHGPICLWNNPTYAVALLHRWEEVLNRLA